MNERHQRRPIKELLTDWGKIAILFLDEAAVVVIVVLVLHFFDISIPAAVTIPLAVFLGIFVFILHIKVIPSFRRRQVTGREGMTGETAEVTKTLAPNGIVVYHGEHWKAVSSEGTIESGEEVEITGISGLTLKVKQKRNRD